MAHACTCHSGGATLAKGKIQADERVGEVTHAHPGTLEVMKDLGINHCCGAQLTLAEAAASADVPLELLLATLSEVVEADS